MRVVIIGIDGDLIRTIREEGICSLVGVVDRADSDQRTSISRVASDEDWAMWHSQNSDVRAVLSVDIPARRQKLVEAYGAACLTGYISTRAHVSETAVIGNGAVVQREGKVHQSAGRANVLDVQLVPVTPHLGIDRCDVFE